MSRVPIRSGAVAAPFVFYTGTYATAKDVALARRLGATRFLGEVHGRRRGHPRDHGGPPERCRGASGGRLRDRARRDRVVASLQRVADRDARTSQPRTRRRGPRPAGADPWPRAAAGARQPDRHARAHRVREPPLRGGHRLHARHGEGPDARRAAPPARRRGSRLRDSGQRCWPGRSGAASSSTAARMARSTGNVR